MAVSVGFYEEFEFTDDISGTPTWTALDPSKIYVDGDAGAFQIEALGDTNANREEKYAGETLSVNFLYETDEDDTNNTELDALLALRDSQVWYRTRATGSSNRVVTGGTTGCTVLGAKIKTTGSGRRARTPMRGGTSTGTPGTMQTTEAVA
ncbi:MAG: hypothetical protein AAFU38_13980 [Bacteroidota bacterium]